MSTDLALLMSGENAALVGCIVALISVLRSVFREFFTGRIGERLLPVLPVVMGIVATLIGFGTADEMGGTWQDKVVLGSVVGFAAGQIFKMGRTSVFGWGLPDRQPRQPGKRRWFKRKEEEQPLDVDEGDASNGS